MAGVGLLEVPGTHVGREGGPLTAAVAALPPLLRGFFAGTEVCVRPLGLPAQTLRPPGLRLLGVPAGAAAPLGRRPAALRRLADPPPLRVRLTGGAPPLPALVPPLLPLGLVIGRAGAFPLLLVRAGAVARLLLLGRRRAGVVPRADLHHERRRLQEAAGGLGVVRVQPLGLPIGGRHALLAPDPVGGDVVGVVAQHGLVVELPGTHVGLERQRRARRPGLPGVPPLLPLPAFVLGAPPVGGRVSRFRPLLGPVPFSRAAAAAAPPARDGFTGSDGNVFLGLDLRGSLGLLHFPEADLGHVVQVPAALRANGRLAAAHLQSTSNTVRKQVELLPLLYYYYYYYGSNTTTTTNNIKKKNRSRES